MSKFSLLVFIGRFQPFHFGHLTVLDAAMTQTDHVLILCGSSEQPPSIRNPWDFSTREQMIRQSLTAKQNALVLLEPIQDILYQDDLWVAQVQDKVAQVCQQLKLPDDASIGLVGHDKDASSYYLKLFPQWSYFGVDNYKDINATVIRNDCFSGELNSVQEGTSSPVQEIVEQWMRGEVCQALAEENQYIQRYQQSWSASPYTPILVTTDVLLEHDGHLLMIKRGGHPGKGLWALPGGFLEAQETLAEGCLRELYEETSLDISADDLSTMFVQADVFDHPFRSSLGRVITQARHFKIPKDRVRPNVVAGDDAVTSKWQSLDSLDSRCIFSDHYSIIQKMLKMVYTSSP